MQDSSEEPAYRNPFGVSSSMKKHMFWGQNMSIGKKRSTLTTWSEMCDMNSTTQNAWLTRQLLKHPLSNWKVKMIVLLKLNTKRISSWQQDRNSGKSKESLGESPHEIKPSLKKTLLAGERWEKLIYLSKRFKITHWKFTMLVKSTVATSRGMRRWNAFQKDYNELMKQLLQDT